MTGPTTLRGHVVTDRPARHIKQLCQHASAMGRAGPHQFKPHGAEPTPLDEVRIESSSTETSGSIEFAPWGRCDLSTTGTGFEIRIVADSPDHVSQLAERIERNIDRFTKGSTAVEWDERPSAPPGRRMNPALAIGLIASAAVAAHLGMVGFLLNRWQWSLGLLAALVAIKVVVMVGLGHRFAGRMSHSRRIRS